MEHIKNLVVVILNRAIVAYIKRNRIKVIAVAGSVGKTSTVHAIRTVLSQKYRIHRPATAYNTHKSIHIELFDLPFVTNPLAWAWTVAKVLIRSFGKANYDMLVIEIGTDYPGDLQHFAFLRPEIGVLTAITPEHMERFKTIEAVAKEELSIADFCGTLICNADAVPKKLVPDAVRKRAVWYGEGTEYQATNYRMKGMTSQADFLFKRNVALQVVGEHSLGALLAAAAVGEQCGLSHEQILSGVSAVQPVKGRMRRLRGIKGAIIIDDSYNASPDAAKAALDVLRQIDAPQHIAVLGMMNEMGEYSPKAHNEVGAYCDPQWLDLVVTIGVDANNYLAAAAEERGCTVKCFSSPYEAGEYIRQQLQPGAVLLFKGSQNGVYAEEAIKAVLDDKTDEEQLVRQSEYWMKKKRAQFGRSAEAA